MHRHASYKTPFNSVHLVGTFGNKGQETTCEHILLCGSSLCSLPSQRHTRLCFTPTGSVTHHEVSLVNYIWSETFQTATPAQHYFICMVNVPSIFHYGSWPSRLSRVSLIRLEVSWDAATAKLRSGKNDIACGCNPSAILSGKAGAFLAFYLS